MGKLYTTTAVSRNSQQDALPVAGRFCISRGAKRLCAKDGCPAISGVGPLEVRLKRRRERRKCCAIPVFTGHRVITPGVSRGLGREASTASLGVRHAFRERAARCWLKSRAGSNASAMGARPARRRGRLVLLGGIRHNFAGDSRELLIGLFFLLQGFLQERRHVVEA